MPADVPAQSGRAASMTGGVPGRAPDAILRAFASALLSSVGTPADEADLVADALVDADLEGLGSHGLLLLPMYLERIAAGSVRPGSSGTVVTDLGARVVIDAGHALGHVTAERAAALASERARVHGVGLVAVRNAFHFGAAGRYARRITVQGQIGIVMANTRPMMPAPGGAERVVGNNPIAIAVPTREQPVVLDLALSAGAMGKIRLAEAGGQPIPDGWAATAEGLPTHDAGEAIRGMLLPAGGAKGFGLALMVDLLTGGLSSGAIGDAVRPLYGDIAEPYGSANLFLAIEIEGLRPLPDFEAAASAFTDRVRASRRAPGAGSVRIPGDRADAAHRNADGTCRITPATLAALREAAARLGVAVPDSLA